MPGAADVVALDPVVRRYAWGSPSAIPQLLGQEPDGRPVAELWFGAHPDDPSPVSGRGLQLEQFIAADPPGVLGAEVARRFDAQLPFLVKILAAQKALSIQVHPTLAQARAGFAAEDARGVPRTGEQRNYRDANHKPELICALSSFTALCGFRAPAQILELIAALPAQVSAALDEVRADLAVRDTSRGLRAAFSRLLTLPEPGRGALVEAVVSGCRAMLAEHPTPAGPLDGPLGAAWVLAQCARDFPGDVGAVLTLLLNPLVLAPGESIYLGAGTVHCYLRGMGVEVMANSDNVLRCGLTPKHVDVAELLAITDFSPLAEPRCQPRQAGALRCFDTPAPDFRLSIADLRPDAGPLRVAEHGPHIVLCSAGDIEVRSAAPAASAGPAATSPAAAAAAAVARHETRLVPGRGAFLSEGDFEVGGTGQAFIAGVGPVASKI